MADTSNNRDQELESARRASSLGDWESEERWWRENFTNRPYATADRGFDFYRPGYRYGWDAANRYGGRQWNDIEPELRNGWESSGNSGEHHSTWEEIKDSVRDAWDHLTGHEHQAHRVR